MVAGGAERAYGEEYYEGERKQEKTECIQVFSV
jgi:hypothetical protein